MNKNLLLGIFGNVAPQGKIIKYISSEAVSGGWVDNNTDTNRNTFVNGEGTLYLNDGVTSIGGETWSTDDSPFYHRTDVIAIDLSNSGLIYINNLAFNSCNALTSIVIPNSVTKIGSWAFYGCIRLTSINIPDSVTSIGDFAFSGCSGLISVTIGGSVTGIGDSAFNGCSGLASITIPNSLTSIGIYAFGGCSSLTEVTCLATTPPTLGTGNFTASNDTLYVPIESVSVYESDANWSAAFTTITAIQ